MVRIDKQLSGTGSGLGVIVMSPDPDFTNGRAAGGPIHALPYLNKSADITVGGTATVDAEGSQDGANWSQIATFSASGQWFDSDVWPFIRFRVTAHTAGDVTVRASFQSN